MGQIQRLTRGLIKPYNSLPRIDWSDPIVQGLSTYCYGTDGSIIDLVNGGQFTAVGCNGVKPTGFGNYLQFPLTGYGYMPPLTAGKTIPFGGSAPFSTAIGTIFNTTATGPGFTSDGDCALVQVLDAANTTNTFSGFNTWPPGAAGNPNPATTTLACEVGNSTNAYFTPTVIPNTFQSWGMACPNNTTGLLYSLGLFDNTFSGTVNFNGASQGQVMYGTASINSGQSFGNGISGAIPYFAVWSRVLSPAEYLRLATDPWSFLIYPEEDFFIVGTNLIGSTALMAQAWM